MKSLKILFSALLLALASTINIYAQDADSTQKYYIETKLNAPALVVGIVNFGVEVGFSKHSAIELSNVTSFNEENFMWSGRPLILNMTMLEYRYYLCNELHKGLFVGGDFAWDVFKMHKSIVPGYADSSTDRDYDWGYGLTLGATLGYKFQVAKRWFIEASLSAGWRLTRHEPYINGTVDIPMNASGEWLPYKCGVYISYRF